MGYVAARLRPRAVMVCLAGALAAVALAACSGQGAAPTYVGQNSAQLNAAASCAGGADNAGGLPCEFFWEYTPAFGGANLSGSAPAAGASDTPIQGGSGNTNGQLVPLSTVVWGLNPGESYEYKFCGMGDTVASWVCLGNPDGSGPEAFSTFSASDVPPGFETYDAAGCQQSGACTSNGKPIPIACSGNKQKCEGGPSLISLLKGAINWAEGVKRTLYGVEWKFIQDCAKAVPSPAGISTSSTATLATTMTALGTQQGFRVAAVSGGIGLATAVFGSCLEKYLGG